LQSRVEKQAFQDAGITKDGKVKGLDFLVAIPPVAIPRRKAGISRNYQLSNIIEDYIINRAMKIASCNPA